MPEVKESKSALMRIKEENALNEISGHSIPNDDSPLNGKYQIKIINIKSNTSLI